MNCPVLLSSQTFYIKKKTLKKEIIIFVEGGTLKSPVAACFDQKTKPYFHLVGVKSWS